MLTRPSVIPAKTSKQAHAEYKKYGPRISSQEARQLQRGAELLERADKIKENEQRSRKAKQRKLQQQAKEREERSRRGMINQRQPKIAASQQELNQFLRQGRREAHMSSVKNTYQAIDKHVADDDQWNTVDDDELLQMMQCTFASGENPNINPNTSKSINTYHSALPSRHSHCIQEQCHHGEETRDSQQIVNTISQGNVSFRNPPLFSSQDIGFSADDLAVLGIHNGAQSLDFRRESDQASEGHNKTSLCVLRRCLPLLPLLPIVRGPPVS